MRKFIYIFFFAFSLSLVGCSKIDIAPNKCNEEMRDNQNDNEKGLSESTGKDLDDLDDDETITDPNHDEDEDNNSNNV
jgi:hypothetical protein